MKFENNYNIILQHTMEQIIYISRLITSFVIVLDIILFFIVLPVLIIAYIMHVKAEKYIKSILLEDQDEPVNGLQENTDDIQ